MRPTTTDPNALSRPIKPSTWFDGAPELNVHTFVEVRVVCARTRLTMIARRHFFC